MDLYKIKNMESESCNMYLNISKIRNSLMGIEMIMIVITIIGANIYKCIVNKAIKSKVN